MSDPARAKPTGSYAAYFERSGSKSTGTGSATADTPHLDAFEGPVKWQVILAGNPIGYLGMNSDEWCVVVPTIEYALRIQPVFIENGRYKYRIADREDRCLAVGGVSDYVGLYPWSGATEWTPVRVAHHTDVVCWGRMGSDPMSYWSEQDNFVYATSDPRYKPLSIKYIRA